MSTEQRRYAEGLVFCKGCKFLRWDETPFGGCSPICRGRGTPKHNWYQAYTAYEDADEANERNDCGLREPGFWAGVVRWLRRWLAL